MKKIIAALLLVFASITITPVVHAGENGDWPTLQELDQVGSHARKAVLIYQSKKNLEAFKVLKSEFMGKGFVFGAFEFLNERTYDKTLMEKLMRRYNIREANFLILIDHRGEKLAGYKGIFDEREVKRKMHSILSGG